MNTTTLTRSIAIAAIAISAVTLSGCSLLSNILPGGSSDLYSLNVGDCLDGAGGAGTVEDVPVVDCATPHEEEVYVVTDVDLDEYPGDTALSDQGGEFCLDAFEGFVGLAYQDSLLDYWVLYPSEETFAQGDRQIVCSISKFDENGEMVKVTGSLEGSQE